MQDAIFEERQNQVHRKGEQPFALACNKESLAGAVSQRACVFCGSRVVLYPIADALHLLHGPIGCAAYTWDIRGPCPPSGGSRVFPDLGAEWRAGVPLRRGAPRAPARGRRQPMVGPGPNT